MNSTAERQVKTIEKPKISHRGKLTHKEVAQKAESFFESIRVHNAWDRRRILQRIERLNKLA